MSGAAARPGQGRAILELEGVGKSFAGARALDDVDFELVEGEIHALVGENGAGKSTLIKIVTGVYTRDEGDYVVDGELQGQLTPSEASALGIEVIHQDRQLVPHFTVAETLALGRTEPRRHGLLARKEMNAGAERVLREWLGADIPPTAVVGELAVAQQQLVQIARALAGEPRILVLDEPTAPLSRDDVERLFAILRDLKARGISMIYISHHLREVTEICDRVTVLRNGRRVGTIVVEQPQVERQLVRMMVGREVDERRQRRQVTQAGAVALRVADLEIPPALMPVSVTLRWGEIVGVTGLVGSGTRELARAVGGLAPAEAGHVTFTTLNEDGGPRYAERDGRRRPAFVPEDCRGEGVVLDMTVQENITLASLREHSRRGLLSARRERRSARELIEKLDVRPPDPEAGARYMSGGNQQKIVLARWLVANPDVFVLDQPTAGVDLGARADIHRLIDELVDDGAAVLLVSYDLDELFRLSDRIVVMYRGAIVAEAPADRLTHEAVLELSTGAAGTAEEALVGDGHR